MKKRIIPCALMLAVTVGICGYAVNKGPFLNYGYLTTVNSAVDQLMAAPSGKMNGGQTLVSENQEALGVTDEPMLVDLEFTKTADAYNYSMKVEGQGSAYTMTREDGKISILQDGQTYEEVEFEYTAPPLLADASKKIAFEATETIDKAKNEKGTEYTAHVKKEILEQSALYVMVMGGGNLVEDMYTSYIVDKAGNLVALKQYTTGKLIEGELAVPYELTLTVDSIELK